MEPMLPSLRGLPSKVCACGAQTHALTLDIYAQAREYVAEKNDHIEMWGLKWGNQETLQPSPNIRLHIFKV